MKPSDFTKGEIDKIIKLSNFTDEELKAFVLKTQNKTITQCAYEMNCSERTVTRKFKKAMLKVARILPYLD